MFTLRGKKRQQILVQYQCLKIYLYNSRLEVNVDIIVTIETIAKLELRMSSKIVLI
jgi:hypothetical protein